MASAPICALYAWATPHDARPLGALLQGLVFVTVPVMGAFLILAWRGYLRFGLPILLSYLLLVLPGSVPAVGAAGGGWPGGWALGVAGLVVGAVYGWLSMRLLWLNMRVHAAARDARSPGPTAGAGPGRDAAEPGAPADAGREPGSS